MAARALREHSWDSVHSSDASQDIQESLEEDDTPERQPRIRTLQDVHNAIHPLRAAADRVGKEVEQFAISLDRLAGRQSSHNDYRKVLPVVREYEKIATETVARLRRYHEAERQERLKGRWRRKVQQARTPTPSVRSRSGGPDSGTNVDDLENWEQERQTWQLLRLILQCQFPANDGSRALPNQESQYQRPASGGTIHEYSSENELWNTFLSECDDVWEKHVVVEWLKSNAESNGPSIDVVIEELDEAANRGQGLSAHGWLYSKEAIKGHKRLRGVQHPLDGATTASGLTNKDKTKKLVTQLDPDAFSRQGREIEKEDSFFERAAWLGCWEMLRRGQSWQAIRNFCQERVEGWRALSIRGDPRLIESNKSGLNVQSGPRSRTLWRKMCEKAAKDGGIDVYENAVYGLLSGNQEAMETVARGWDDYLFVLYNSQVLQQFDYYIEKSVSSRLPQVIDGRSEKLFAPVKPSVLSGRETWESLLSHDKTKVEARNAIKMLQGSLIARLFEKYIHQQGLALGRSVAGNGNKAKRILRGTSEEPVELGASADVTVEDYDILRIMTHIILVFMELEAFKGTSVATENIIFAYVSFLANAGKHELIPVYASKLSEKASIELMARQLHLISNASEQKTMTALMGQYGLNISAILQRHLLFLSEKVAPNSKENEFTKLNLIGAVESGSFNMPGIKAKFLTKALTPEESDLIRAVEWYLSVDGAWEDTMWAGTLVYKHFLRTGSFGAAAVLASEIPFERISMAKTRAIIGVQENLAEEWLSRNNDDQDRKVEVMLRQANTLIGLENMMRTLTYLDKWQQIWEVFLDDEIGLRPRLQNAHNKIELSVEHLLHDWLQQPATDAEKAELDSIRTTYLPEIILSYISVIYFGGHKLSRELLLRTMNLAIDIAANGSEVGACFQAAGRMSQLMDFMAVSGLAVMRAEEARNLRKGGKSKKIRAGRNGENLDVWNMRAARKYSE